VKAHALRLAGGARLMRNQPVIATWPQNDETWFGARGHAHQFLVASAVDTDLVDPAAGAFS
jgi:hypothetical protein